MNLLLREGTKWEYKELLEKKGDRESLAPKERNSLFKKRLILLAFSIIACYFLNEGFNSNFTGYVIAGLSIFVGLFINLIIVLYQRYISTDTNLKNENAEQPKPDDDKRLQNIKVKDFIRQFTFVTGKNILIATLFIIASTFSLLFNTFFSSNTDNFYLIKHFKDLEPENIFLMFKYLFIQIFRISILYLLFDFFLLLLYSIGSLFAFLKGEYNND